MFLAFDRRILNLSLTTLSGSNSQYQLKKHNYHGIAPPYPNSNYILFVKSALFRKMENALEKGQTVNDLKKGLCIRK